jgi:hypothetical protein
MTNKQGVVLPLLFGLLLSLCCAREHGGASENLLTAETPIPNQSLLEMVVSMDYPQQTRMNAMTRVAEQASEDDAAERADWFAAIVWNSSTPSVIRGHALDQLFVLKQEPEGLTAWLMAVANDPDSALDWRLVCLSRLDGVHGLSRGVEREDIPALLAALVADGDEMAAGAALLTLARLGGRNGEARDLASSAMEQILAASNSDPELVLSALLVNGGKQQR